MYRSVWKKHPACVHLTIFLLQDNSKDTASLLAAEEMVTLIPTVPLVDYTIVRHGYVVYNQVSAPPVILQREWL